MNPEPERRTPWNDGGNRRGSEPPEGPRRPRWERLLILAIIIFGVIVIGQRLYPGDLSEYQYSRLLYLVLLLAVIAGGSTLWSRMPTSQLARNTAIWVVIFALAIGIGAFWEDLGFAGRKIGRSVLPGVATVGDNGEIIVSRRNDGHFYLAADVNGARVMFLVDTGATEVALTQADAARAGIKVTPDDFYGRVSTANGEASAAPVTIDEITVAGLSVYDVRAHVAGGEMSGSLLGMSFLERFSSYEVRGGQLYLRP